MTIVDVPDDGNGRRGEQPWLDTSFPVFTVHVRQGPQWRQLAEPQRDARTACMMLAAFIWKNGPDTPLLQLQKQVEDTVRRLAEGAREVTIADGRHRVVRTDLFLDIPLDGLSR